MQLVGDLPGRASVFEQSEHLGLPRREVRVWRCRRFLELSHELAEDADDVIAVPERHREISSVTLVWSALRRTPSVSVTETAPMILRVKSSRARCVSSGATTEVKCRPRTSPTSSIAAGLTQRITPAVSTT